MPKFTVNALDKRLKSLNRAIGQMRRKNILDAFFSGFFFLSQDRESLERLHKRAMNREMPLATERFYVERLLQLRKAAKSTYQDYRKGTTTRKIAEDSYIKYKIQYLISLRHIR